MKSILAVVGVCAILLIGSYFLLGVRGKVIKDKVNEGLDKIIGPEAIKEKQFKEDLKELGRVIEQVTERRVRKEVQKKNLEKEIKDEQAKISDYQNYGSEVLAAVEMAKKSPLVTFQGSQYNKEELDRLAGRVADNLKGAMKILDDDKAKLADLEKAVKIWQDREDSLTEKKKKYERELAKIQSNLKDAEVLRNDAKTMGDSDKGLEDRLKALDERVAKMSEDAEVKHVLADKKWKDVTAQIEKDNKEVDISIPPSKSGASALEELLKKPAGKDK